MLDVTMTLSMTMLIVGGDDDVDDYGKGNAEGDGNFDGNFDGDFNGNGEFNDDFVAISIINDHVDVTYFAKM